VPIFQLLAKFDSVTVSDDIKAGRRRFRVTKLPRFLALHFKRFTKNNFFIEKNPTLVTFPVKNLELRDAMQGLPDGAAPAAAALIADPWPRFAPALLGAKGVALGLRRRARGERLTWHGRPQ
jgi:U4/U6.U5 tri-snRNP-associated protein 2